LYKYSANLKYIRYLYENGTTYLQGDIFEQVEKESGYPMVMLERQQLLQALYDGVKDKSRCLDHTPVVSFHEDDNGVTVKCKDGTTYRGAILVGADGVRSKVREYMMDRLEEESDQKDIIQKARNAAFVQFSCVFGIASAVEGLDDPGHAWFVTGTRRSLMIASGRDGRIFFFLLEDIPIVYGHDIPKYTAEDARKSMEAVFHLPIHNGVTVGDMFAKHTFCVKVSLEEHVYEYSYSGRTCLVGDSLHKMTINDGFGGIMAIESAVVLTNLIKKHFPNPPEVSVPLETVSNVLRQYSDHRKARVPWVTTLSGITTRLQAGSNFMYRMLRYTVLPYLPLRALSGMFMVRHRPGASLDFIPKPKHKGTQI